MSKYAKLFNLNKMIIDLFARFLSIKRLPFYLREKKTRNNNVNLKNFKNSDKCFICGLGPSLKEVDFSKLDGDTIVVNHFYKFNTKVEFEPTFYCMTDDSFFNIREIDSLKDAYKKYNNSTFLLNGKYKQVIENEIKSRNNIYYSFMWKGYFRHKRIIDYTKLTFVMNNIICEAVSLALYVGYKEIILLGCDFNSFASTKSTHCYVGNSHEREISLAFELFNYSFVADTHYELDKYSKILGARIINATPESLIDAYEKSEQHYI